MNSKPAFYVDVQINEWEYMNDSLKTLIFSHIQFLGCFFYCWVNCNWLLVGKRRRIPEYCIQVICWIWLSEHHSWLIENKYIEISVEVEHLINPAQGCIQEEDLRILYGCTSWQWTLMENALLNANNVGTSWLAKLLGWKVHEQEFTSLFKY